MSDTLPLPAPPERKKQIVAAKNILFGTGYFLILDLPQGWGLTRSYLEPDVHSTVTREHITWVEAGQTDQIVFNPYRKIALDLMIRIKLGKHDLLDLKEVQVSSQGPGMIGGHPASYCFGEVQQGLFKKKIYKTLRTCFYCRELQHTLFLHFTGQCQEADLQEIYESLRDLECH
jgi:hypothetical protein